MQYTYTLKRSAARKTISIKILTDNTIIVSCPKSTAIEKIKTFLNEKSAWIEKHLVLNERSNGKFSAVIEGRAVLVKGEQIPFRISDRDCLDGNGLSLTSVEKLKGFYVKNFGGEFCDLLNEISKSSGLRYTKVSIRSYKSRWGCCNKKRELTFNYKLLMLPKEIWAYVIIHELCHTQHMDHSASFWNCVSFYMPNYRIHIQNLKQYSFLCTMY